MSMLRRFAPLLVSVALVGALGAVGLRASAGANNKAETMHRRDRETLQTTLAGLGKQYTLFAFKEEMDFASTGPWSLRGILIERCRRSPRAPTWSSWCGNSSMP